MFVSGCHLRRVLDLCPSWFPSQNPSASETTYFDLTSGNPGNLEVCVCTRTCVCVCVSHNSIHSAIIVHVGYFCVLAILNNAVMYWGCRYLCEFMFLFPLDIFPEAELLDHVVDMFLIF